MSFFETHLLTAIVFVPLVGAILALAFPREEHSGVRPFALVVSLVDLALGLWLWHRFEPQNTGLQFLETLSWIPSLGITYSVGVDGLSILLVVLTVFLAPLVILGSYSGVSRNVREYLVCLLFLQTGMLGAFVAVDLFLFYVFWEVMLLPMYFLIGVWGGPNRIYAAIKFFIYTMAGSLLMLVAIVYLVWSVKEQGGITFAWAEIVDRLPKANLGGAEVWLFLAFCLAFAIKVPMFPLHTWLPDAHVEAPTGASVILAGVLLKLGTFGFLRYALWLFPATAAAFLPAIGLLAVIGIIYGSLLAMVQEDLKRLVAYSSVAHLGFVMLGIAAMTVSGVAGGTLQMLNHGISTGALFLLVGVIYERRHTRLLEDFGGLAKVMPRFAAVFILIALGSVGLPGLNGFVGEFLILLGAFESQGIMVPFSVGKAAVAGLLAANIVGFGAVVLLGFALGRLPSEKLSLLGKVGVVLAGFIGMAALVLPPVAGFSGGIVIRPLLGFTKSAAAFDEVFAVLAVLAALGVILSAVYLLTAVGRVFFGPIRHPANENLPDLSLREGLVLAPLVLATVLMGVFPNFLLDVISPTAAAYTQKFRARAGIVATQNLGLKNLPQAGPANLPESDSKIAPSIKPPGLGSMPTRPVLPYRESINRHRRRFEKREAQR